MKNKLFAFAAAALLSGTAAVWAQGIPQDQSQSPRAQTKDQMARPDAQPGVGEDQKGPGAGTDQNMQGPNREDRNMQPTQMQGGERGPQGGEMLRGGETMRGGTHVRLTVEQKTNLRATVLRGGPRLTHINFHIGVGVHIPRTVRLVAVPEAIVSIYPEWANYEYFAYGDEVVIVDPATLAIVGVLPL